MDGCVAVAVAEAVAEAEAEAVPVAVAVACGLWPWANLLSKHPPSTVTHLATCYMGCRHLRRDDFSVLTACAGSA